MSSQQPNSCLGSALSLVSAPSHPPISSPKDYLRSPQAALPPSLTAGDTGTPGEEFMMHPPNLVPSPGFPGSVPGIPDP